MKRALLFAWLTTGSLFAFSVVWELVEHHQAYKSAPPGWIVDYFTPWPVIIAGMAGFWGLIVVAFISLFVFIRSQAFTLAFLVRRLTYGPGVRRLRYCRVCGGLVF